MAKSTPTEYAFFVWHVDGRQEELSSDRFTPL